MKLSPETFPYQLIVLKETESTNQYLNQLCDNSEEPIEEFTTVYTDFQTAGKGQRGNSWESEAHKNLLFSFVIYPTFIEAHTQFLISACVSLAIKEELEKHIDNVAIKWPNDIYVEDKKVGGILIEHQLTGSTITRTVVGIGLNINQEQFVSDAPNPVSLKQITGKTYDQHKIMQNIVKRVEDLFACMRVDRTGANAIQLHAFYTVNLYRKTGFHPYRDANGEFRAKLQGVKPDGRLVLEDESGKEREYMYKEVQYL